jgi:hypothetical protein
VFLWNKAIGDLKRKFSSTEDMMALQKVKDINDLFCYMHDRNSNTSIESFNEWINSYFSDSVFDMAYL